MTPEEYKVAWKRYVHELKGEGAEAKILLTQLERAWKGYSPDEQTEATRLLFAKEVKDDQHLL